MKKYNEGEKDQHRLTVHGLSFLRDLDREIDSRKRASRCFRKELRCVIIAFATRTRSAIAGFCFGCAVLSTFPTVGIIGRTGVGIVEARSIGCVLIGPAVGLILDNSLRPNLFKRVRT
jgi:hypothetical protein